LVHSAPFTHGALERKTPGNDEWLLWFLFAAAGPPDSRAVRELRSVIAFLFRLGVLVTAVRCVAQPHQREAAGTVRESGQ